MRAAALVACGLLGCTGGGSTTPPPPQTPPQVFLTLPEAVVLGPSISGTVSVTGCEAVSQVRLLAADKSFIANAGYTGNPSSWTLQSGALARLYATSGIALPLTLLAEVLCADGRTNVSQPAAATFFPAASVLTQPGVQLVPDAFVGTGGVGGTPVTFLGCVGTPQGPALARVNTSGSVVRQQTQLPFACTLRSQITEASAATQTRWLFEPGVGAFAFDANLAVTAVVTGELAWIGVADDGNAVFGEETTGARAILRARPNPVGTASPVVWRQMFAGTMNAAPAIDPSTGAVYASSWQYTMGTGEADFVVFRFGYADGALLNAVNGQVPVLLRQSYGLINQPVMPVGAFSANGSLLYLPLQGATSGGAPVTSVIACATAGGACTGSSRRWTSMAMPGVLNTVVPFSNDAFIAVAGALGLGFLSASDGANVLPGGGLLLPTGSLRIQSVLPGRGADFYALAGPATAGSYPSEIIAVDAPRSGELWRLAVGAGTSARTGMFVAVDDNAQPWLRVGADLVKPLTHAEYRSARGGP